MGEDGLRELLQFGAVGKLELLVVAEVELQLQQRGHVQQLVAQSRQFPAHLCCVLRNAENRHPCRFGMMGGTAGRGNQVGHGLGLAQVQFAGQKGTLRELPAQGLAATALDEQLHHPADDIPGPVATDFRGIFASIRVGGTINAHHHFVHHLAPTAITVGG